MLLGDKTLLRRASLNSLMILLVLNLNHFFIGPPLQVSLNIIVWVTYSILLFLPRTWWTKTRMVIAGIVIAVETVIGMVWFHERALIYFIAIFILSVVIRMSLARSPIPVIAVMIIVAAIYSKYGHYDFFNLLSFVLLAVVFYFTIRSRMQRNEMHEQNKRHLTELQEAYEQLQEASVTSMQYAVLEERTRIARDIHDAVGHSLTSLIVQMQALRYMIKKDPEQAAQSLEGMLVVARQGLQDIRTSVHSLADDRSVSGVTSLKALLSRMEASAGLCYVFHADLQEEVVGVEEYGILFKVLQEAITNVIRHAKATEVEVAVTNEAGRIVMRIRDNGILEAGQKIAEGFGFLGMKSRLEERGGTLSYSILEPRGFELVAELPRRDERVGG